MSDSRAVIEGSRSPARGPRATSYVPPPASLVHMLGLVDLLPKGRAIPPQQQQRFDFAARALWCVGDVSLTRRPCIAIVGTRDVSPNGAARARRLARELAEAGVVVVSGLAKGVDTEALTAAADARGHVIAVIGTPIDKAYPAENKRLQERIYREHLLVSQFAPGGRVFPGNFPTRNKLMAAISDATVIIEASNSSGALHQAAECTRLDRWLFIANSVFEDPKVTWPKDFERYQKTRRLRSTSELLEALGTASCP